MREHALAVFRREIHRLEFDPQNVGHRRRIDQVHARRAIFVRVVVFPVLHEDTDDLVALPLQQPGGDGRVHATGEADDDPLCVNGHQASSCTKFSGQRLPAR